MGSRYRQSRSRYRQVAATAAHWPCSGDLAISASQLAISPTDLPDIGFGLPDIGYRYGNVGTRYRVWVTRYRQVAGAAPKYRHPTSGLGYPISATDMVISVPDIGFGLTRYRLIGRFVMKYRYPISGWAYPISANRPIWAYRLSQSS